MLNDSDDALPEGMVEEAQVARERRAKAQALWRQLRAGSLHPADTLTALRAIGKGGLIEVCDEVAAYLRADDNEERRMALMVLGLDFGLPEYADTALDFLEHDPDTGCRLMGRRSWARSARIARMPLHCARSRD